MNKQIQIAAFHEMLKMESTAGSLLEVLQSLTKVNDPKLFAQVKGGPKPLGGWGGWRLA